MSGLEQQFVQETFASKTTASTTSCRPLVADSCACWSKECSANGKSSRSTVTPWLTVAIGVLVIAVGVALLLGRQLSFALPKLERGGRTGGLASMFVFGISYAIASVSCTLPVFLSQVSSTLGESLARGTTVFLLYSLGMALVLTALSVSLALARTELVNALRNSLGVINRVAGGFLVLAGLYVTWYAIYEITERNDSDPAVDRVTGWSSDLANRVTDIGVWPLAGVLVLGIAVALIVGLLRSRSDTEA